MGRVLAQTERMKSNEFEFTDKDFKFVQWFLHKNVGIYLSDRKRTMVYGRVSRQIRRLGLQRFAEYREVIERDDEERISFINCLTTNKTQFFREYHHFEFMEKVMMKEWKSQGLKSLRIWSAGCSTGEEPYSFISSLYHCGAFQWFDEIGIVASDLDTNVLNTAKDGVYSEEALDSIPNGYLKPCFVKGRGDRQGQIKVSGTLQKFIDFRQINLLDEWPFENEFDIISCRNVMIYFDKQTQEKLLSRFYQQLKPNGILFIGHSESVGACAPMFRHLGHTIYVKQ
ncbi:CheR family methyltransferase [Vibrio sonorensis]|uniref:CheR family methyltransferase n=1 Tax=Vibrio sonorensis TaxID=1004316 RepID=UPI0008D9EC72|nr:protein-glutamate O-methyltransferase CheR [Vibrio sonorensis]